MIKIEKNRKKKFEIFFATVSSQNNKLLKTKMFEKNSTKNQFCQKSHSELQNDYQ